MMILALTVVLLTPTIHVLHLHSMRNGPGMAVLPLFHPMVYFIYLIVLPITPHQSMSIITILILLLVQRPLILGQINQAFKYAISLIFQWVVFKFANEN